MGSPDSRQLYFSDPESRLNNGHGATIAVVETWAQALRRMGAK
ncbi:MAG: hypothetical protein ABIS06_00470 [Vicinamibacterales bacterium]